MSASGYEFKIIEWPIHGTDALGVEESLNRYGKEGWQIVGMHERITVSHLYDVKTVLMIFMQRPLYSSAARFTMGEM